MRLRNLGFLLHDSLIRLIAPTGNRSEWIGILILPFPRMDMRNYVS